MRDPEVKRVCSLDFFIDLDMAGDSLKVDATFYVKVKVYCGGRPD